MVESILAVEVNRRKVIFMALFEVYEMNGKTAVSLLITQSHDEAVTLAHKLQAQGKPVFWEQIQ